MHAAHLTSILNVCPSPALRQQHRTSRRQQLHWGRSGPDEEALWEPTRPRSNKPGRCDLGILPATRPHRAADSLGPSSLWRLSAWPKVPCQEPQLSRLARQRPSGKPAHQRPAAGASSTAWQSSTQDCSPSVQQLTRVYHCRRQPQLGGFGGPGNGSGSGNYRRLGGGGSGDGWNSGGDGSWSSTWSLQASSASVRWQGWEDRVRADPSFKDKVLIEQVDSGTRAMTAMQQASLCRAL